MDKQRESFAGLIELIQKHTESEDAANLLLYFEDKAAVAQYSGLGSLYRYEGGLVDYLTKTIETSLKLATIYKRFGAEPTYTTAELVRSIVFYELSLLTEDYQYLPAKDRNISVLLDAKVSISQNEYEFLRFAPDPFNKQAPLNTIGFIVLRAKEILYEVESPDGDEVKVIEKPATPVKDKIEVKTAEPVAEVEPEPEPAVTNEEPPFDPDPVDGTDVDQELEAYFDDEDESEDDSIEDLIVDDPGDDKDLTTEEAFDYEAQSEQGNDPMREEAAASFEEIFGENVFEDN